jgi:hypothetical protein
MAGGNRRPLHALCELTGHNRAVRLPSKPQEWWMPKGLLLARLGPKRTSRVSPLCLATSDLDLPGNG